MDEQLVTALRIILRLIHIVGGVAWVGLGATMVFFVGPAIGAAGESGLRFMKSMYARTAIARAIPYAAVVTVVAGILLYIVANSPRYFTQTGNIVLGIGALFGLLAIGHGGAVAGRANQAMEEALRQHVPDDGTVSPEGLTALRELALKMNTNSRISFYLSVIALIAMASARYL